jgi:hypothetical protein
MAVLADLEIIEAIHFFQDHFSVLNVAENMPAGRGANVNCQIILQYNALLFLQSVDPARKEIQAIIPQHILIKKS